VSTVSVEPDVPADWPLWAGIFAAEAVALGTYLLTVGGVDQLRYALYPFVWINVGLYAVARVDRPTVQGRRLWLAAGTALAYGVVLGVVTGLVGLPHVGHAHPSGLQVSLSAPGWGPRIAYVLDGFHLYFVPYRVVGYVALSYLLFVRLADLSLASGAGILGVASCLGCAFPLVTSLFAGAGAATLAAVTGYSLDLSTAAFILAVAALWMPWRS
jgi:hypothetical protein